MGPARLLESSQDGKWDGLLDSGVAGLRPRPHPHGRRGRGLFVLGERGGRPDSHGKWGGTSRQPWEGEGDVPTAVVQSVTAPC